MYNILNCKVDMPRINQPYRWDDHATNSRTAETGDKGNYVACDGMQKDDKFMINLLLTEDQAKAMASAMREEYKKIAAEKKYPTGGKTWKPSSLADLFDKTDEGWYKARCTQKTYANGSRDKPKQFDKNRMPLPDDFELTSNSLVHAQVRFFCWKANDATGVMIQPKKFRVVELAERMDASNVDDFGDTDDNADESDPFGSPPAPKQSSMSGPVPDDEIPF